MTKIHDGDTVAPDPAVFLSLTENINLIRLYLRITIEQIDKEDFKERCFQTESVCSELAFFVNNSVRLYMILEQS